MKTLNNFYLKGLPLLFIITIITFSGCKDNVVTPHVEGEVHGSITYVNRQGETVGYAGIKIYLMNTSIKPDTVNYANNLKAIIDSTVTNSSGNYEFLNIESGNYGVVPVPSAGNTKISFDSSSPDSYSFSVTEVKRLFTINFKTKDPAFGQSGTPYSIEIRFKNFPALESGWIFLYVIRRVNYRFIHPDYDNSYTVIESGSASDLSKPFTYYYNYGYTTIFYTLSNKFDFRFTEVKLDAELNNVYKNEYNFSYDLTLSFCPPKSVFEYDWTAHTFKRIE